MVLALAQKAPYYQVCCLLNPIPPNLSSKLQQCFQLYTDGISFLRKSSPDFKPEMHLEEREQPRAASLLALWTSGTSPVQKGGSERPAVAHKEICSWESPQSQVKRSILKKKGGRSNGPLHRNQRWGSGEGVVGY